MRYDQNMMNENGVEINEQALQNIAGGSISSAETKLGWKPFRGNSRNDGGWEGSGGSGSSW